MDRASVEFLGSRPNFWNRFQSGARIWKNIFTAACFPLQIRGEKVWSSILLLRKMISILFVRDYFYH